MFKSFANEKNFDAVYRNLKNENLIMIGGNMVVSEKIQKERLSITKQDFTDYEEVRKSGEFNMLTQATQASEVAGMDRVTYMNVLKNYDYCMAKWPDVRGDKR